MNNSIVCMLCAASVTAACSTRAHATDLPIGFEETLILDGLSDPATMAFAPDGRLFIGERIQGRLRVAHYDDDSATWTLNAAPFYSFDIPLGSGGAPESHRSSGLRGFAFDPDFETNGYVYCFYMQHDPRHNRVVRIQASGANPDLASPGETLLLSMPFAASESSGSHNGGAIVVGHDNLLYVSTGDGWNGGDDVQNLSTYTGKIFRIHLDGVVPPDNPFIGQTSPAYEAIYALGLRNPFSMAVHPNTGAIYINDVAGSNKAVVYELGAAANYGHDGYDGIGVQVAEWTNVGTGGTSGRIVSGGAWYPDCGVFAPEYHGRYFTALWGGNGGSTGAITVTTSDNDTTLTSFATAIGHPDPLGTLKPMSVAISPAGDLFYIASSYDAASGKIFWIRPIEPFDCQAGAVPAASTVGLIVLAVVLVLMGTGVIARRTPDHDAGQTLR